MPENPPALPDFTAWPSFPFEGDFRIKSLDPPVAVEPPRSGEDGTDCVACHAPDDAYIWVSERWRVKATERPSGLPAVLILESRSHLDLGDLPNLHAAELGVMIVRLERAIRSLDGVGRVHVNRWGDGAAHLHVWFQARPYGQMQLRGTFLSLWEDILPPISHTRWQEDLGLIAAWLAEFGGRAIAEPPHIAWQSPGTMAEQSPGTMAEQSPDTMAELPDERGVEGEEPTARERVTTDKAAVEVAAREDAVGESARGAEPGIPVRPQDLADLEAAADPPQTSFDPASPSFVSPVGDTSVGGTPVGEVSADGAAADGEAAGVAPAGVAPAGVAPADVAPAEGGAGDQDTADLSPSSGDAAEVPLGDAHHATAAVPAMRRPMDERPSDADPAAGPSNRADADH